MYTTNNIELRIVTSSTIAKFKQNQAFDFNEVVSNSAKYPFSRDTKECLLLSYEVWFKTILKIERLLIRATSDDEMVSNELVKLIDILIADAQMEISDVMGAAPKIFNNTLRKAICKTNFVHIEYLYTVVDSNANQPPTILFPIIINSISNMLHNLLFQLHEIEELMKDSGSEPFLSYTPECRVISETANKYPLSCRAKVYKETFGVDRFHIKNYSEGRIPEATINKLLEDRIAVTNIEKTA